MNLSRGKFLTNKYVIIACAGMAAALPGVVASMTILPVIGVPLTSAALDGLDALLSIVQMPTGIPGQMPIYNNTINEYNPYTEIENRIAKIERQINRIESRVSKLESHTLYTNDDYLNNNDTMYMV
jgi:5-(carboxyamino)imidazole ribonucleotide mutase